MPTAASRLRKRAAKPTHRASQELMRQEIVREWRRQGENVRATVRALGYSSRTVCKYLALAREQWAEETKFDLAAAIEERQAVLGRVESEAWAQFQAARESGSDLERFGAWRYLDLVRKVQADLRDLLGLDAPKQVQVGVELIPFIGDPDWHARKRGVELPQDLETVNRQLEILLSGEGVQAAKLLVAPPPEEGDRRRWRERSRGARKLEHAEDPSAARPLSRELDSGQRYGTCP